MQAQAGPHEEVDVGCIITFTFLHIHILLLESPCPSVGWFVFPHLTHTNTHNFKCVKVLTAHTSNGLACQCWMNGGHWQQSARAWVTWPEC